MNRGEVIARLAEIVRDVATGAELGAVAAALVELAGRLRGGAQLPLAADGEALVTEPAVDDTAAIVERVFAHWQQATGKAGTKLLPERARKIRARLRQFTERELCIAIDGVMTSDFHRGENEDGTEYLDFRTIFKNGEVVEGFIARAGGMPAATGLENHPHAERIGELRAAAAEAMREGRTDDYNRINKQLAKLLKERGDA